MIPSSGNPYYDTKENAQSLVKKGHAHWEGPKRIRCVPDQSKKSFWKPLPSGMDGPTVMQLV